ncbi:MAG: hypothetical protein HQK78_18180 [Desulfobacterales bacterium]|nr:hypothetical protein [Desulfobacterales bacterium]
MNIINNLRLLNSKERYFLFTAATDNPNLNLGQKFINEINATIGIKIPKNHFVAIDYHLDWLYAAITVDITSDSIEHDNPYNTMQGNQEDIDLLIAFEKEDKTVIILIEAKCFGSWTNKQINSKIDRLNLIFETKTNNIVKPYFMLMSPKESKNLKVINGKRWFDIDGKPFWMKLNVPALKMVSRISKTNNKWKIIDR